jgi:UDPglucose 6-dehydrogenase
MKITIIGLGKLGLCNALCLEKAGHQVLGIDIFPEYVQSINQKTLISHEPFVNEYLSTSKNFRATTSLKEGLDFSDIIFIVVQTPNGGGDKFYDHTILSNLLSKINKFKIENKHFIICCTIMPKYIDEIGKLLIQDCPNCTLNYNPEFIAQGNIIRGFQYPDMILIGEESKTTGDLLESIHHSICKNTPIICRMNPLEAEITKIAVNGFITTKIAYANMIGDICHKVGADGNIVTNAMGNDTRIGNKYFTPGYSFGGPCFPRDSRALAKFIESENIFCQLPKAVDAHNDAHVEEQARILLDEDLDEYKFEGICYKENSQVPIIEESAKLKIAKYLVLSGKKVIIKDVEHLIEEVKKEYGNLFYYEVKA